MHVTASPGDDAAWQANYEQVIAFAGTADHSPLIDMATGLGGHVSSLPGSDAAVQRWVAWIADGAPYAPAPAGDTDAGTTGGSDGGAGAAPRFAADVHPVLEKYACGDCHGTAGNYSVARYQDTFGSGTDSTPNVIAGDASSLLVTIVAAGHDGVSNQDVRIIERWVVDGQAAP